jgi:hypothetical protein
MRSQGFNLPQPNTSGTGPVLTPGSINTQSPQFKAAGAKCAASARSALGAAPGAR